MNTQSKIQELQQIIKNQLDAYIGNEIILLDLPYHMNIGDLLIWEGELNYLKQLGCTIKGSHSLFTFNFPDVPPHITFLLHGGGNFGDLYPDHQEFRKKIIQHYPNNPIVLFPQSVWYQDKRNLLQDKEVFAQHNNLILCARDLSTYKCFQENFKSATVLLVPDMAFYINPQIIKKYSTPPKKDILYFKRTDIEFNNPPSYLSGREDIHDWSSLEHPGIIQKMFRAIIFLFKHSKGSRINGMIAKCIDNYATNILRPYLLKTGIKQISSYNSIITTRLHAMILSLLVGRNIRYVDNLTGKLSSFSETWLNDLDNFNKNC